MSFDGIEKVELKGMYAVCVHCWMNMCFVRMKWVFQNNSIMPLR